MVKKEIIDSFCAILGAGLWEKECRISFCSHIDYYEIYRLAQEQSVVGLLTAGLERVNDVKLPKEVVLSYVGETLQIERRNYSMNFFIEDIFNKMYGVGLHPILVKGQGVAQCYNRPLWRSCGDVDILFSRKEYNEAVNYLIPIADKVCEEKSSKHCSLSIGPWDVELHGTLHSRLWKKIDCGLDQIQDCVFNDGFTRKWIRGNTVILLPRVDEDVIFVFSHILQHFFKEGVGLRQICDWCRLIWTYKDYINKELLQHRLNSMGVMSEWKAFAYLAVNDLGMPEDSIPFYSSAARWGKKSERLLAFILETGSFGHNRDYGFYKKPYLLSKMISFGRQSQDTIRYFSIFPLDAIKIWCQRLIKGIGNVAKGQ